MGENGETAAGLGEALDGEEGSGERSEGAGVRVLDVGRLG
jgi:hypothetical protein